MSDGKVAIRLVVRNAGRISGFPEKLDGLGILPVCDEANVRAIICRTPAELDAARNPLVGLFDRTGNWIG